jgi:hypothetical protein
VAEWLGRALQKLVQRFESARDLNNFSPDRVGAFVFAGAFRSPQDPTFVFFVDLQCGLRKAKGKTKSERSEAEIVEAPTLPDQR